MLYLTERVYPNMFAHACLSDQQSISTPVGNTWNGLKPKFKVFFSSEWSSGMAFDLMTDLNQLDGN